MTQHKNELIETIVDSLMDIFEIYSPPVPIEEMLHNPPDGFWEEVDVTQLSNSFRNMTHRYSPRMSMARMLARHIAISKWGKSQGLETLLESDSFINQLARALIMPGSLIKRLNSSSRNPDTVGMQFEVPEEDASTRLMEMI